MPWSDWIQPDDETRSPDRIMIAYASIDADPPATLVGLLDDVEFWIGSGLDWNAVQYRVTGSPALDPLPEPLTVEGEGTVYAMKPGADPSDPYRFVEYESDAAAVIRWDWPAWPYPYGDPFISDKLGSPGSGSASIVEPTDYDDEDSEPFIPGLQAGGIPTKPTGGVTFASFTGAEAVGTELATPPTIGPYEAFTLVTEFDEPELGDNRIYFQVPRDPVAVFRPPRFRYWIPQNAPHLIFQRSDGLGAGAKLVYARDTRQSSGLVFRNY